jgi:hypothetical protein
MHCKKSRVLFYTTDIERLATLTLSKKTPLNLQTLKPLLRTFSTMRTARPTTWSFFSCFYIFAESFDVFLSRFCLFHNSRPADPFIASEWCESIPCVSYFRISKYHLTHIIRQIMDDTREKSGFFGIHRLLLRVYSLLYDSKSLYIFFNSLL